jgi:hypothetical protein
MLRITAPFFLKYILFGDRLSPKSPPLGTRIYGRINQWSHSWSEKLKGTTRSRIVLPKSTVFRLSPTHAMIPT